MFLWARNRIVLHCFAYFVSLCRHVGFQNGRHMKSRFNSLGSIAVIDSVLVSKCMFSGARNLQYFAYFIFLGRHVGFQNGRHLKSSLSILFFLPPLPGGGPTHKMEALALFERERAAEEWSEER